jgi:hypothetical protein
MFDTLEAVMSWPRPPDRLAVEIKAGAEFVVMDVHLDDLHRVRALIEVEQGVGIILRVGTLQQMMEYDRTHMISCLQGYQVLIPYTELADGG